MGFLVLLSIMSVLKCQTSIAESLASQVDPTTPPNGINQTKVFFDIDIKQVQEIVENQMHITLRIIEYTEWTDPRLAYFNNSKVDN